MRCDPAVILSFGSDNNVLLAEMRICRSTLFPTVQTEMAEKLEMERMTKED